LSGATKYIKTGSHKDKVNRLVKRYDDAISELNLGINIDQFKKNQELQDMMEKEIG